MYEKWIAALVLFRFCLYGMDPYCANVCLLFGLSNLMRPGMQLSKFSVPGDQNWNRRKPIRIKDEYVSQLIGEDWHMGEGDCDIWFPHCMRSLATSFLIFLGRWYKPNKPERNKCTKSQYQGMLKKTIFQLGDYGVRVDLAQGAFSEDAALRFCTMGFGAAFLERKEDGFVVDMSSMESLEVRPGYSRFGGRMQLTHELNAVKSLDLWGERYHPDDEEWPGALYIFFGSVASMLIAAQHTVYCHYLDGGFTATVVREMDPQHPWCRVLAPFTVCVINADWGARLLIVGAGGMIDRFTGLAAHEKGNLMKAALRDWRMERFTDEIRRRGFDDHTLTPTKFAYGYWGRKLFLCYEQFAIDYVNMYWSDDALVQSDSCLQSFFQNYRELFPSICGHAPPSCVKSRKELVTFLSRFIWMVTAVHEHSGELADLLLQFDQFHLHAADGDLRDFQSLYPSDDSRLAVLFARGLTTCPGPMLYQSDVSNFTRFLRSDCDPAIAARLMESLRLLHEELASYNESCESSMWQFKTFDPFELKASVTA